MRLASGTDVGITQPYQSMSYSVDKSERRLASVCNTSLSLSLVTKFSSPLKVQRRTGSTTQSKQLLPQLSLLRLQPVQQHRYLQPVEQ